MRVPSSIQITLELIAKTCSEQFVNADLAVSVLVGRLKHQPAEISNLIGGDVSIAIDVDMSEAVMTTVHLGRIGRRYSTAVLVFPKSAATVTVHALEELHLIADDLVNREVSVMLTTRLALNVNALCRIFYGQTRLFPIPCRRKIGIHRRRPRPARSTGRSAQASNA